MTPVLDTVLGSVSRGTDTDGPKVGSKTSCEASMVWTVSFVVLTATLYGGGGMAIVIPPELLAAFDRLLFVRFPLVVPSKGFFAYLGSLIAVS